MKTEVHLFDKPSGDTRGVAIQLMDFQKGKKTVEKRICHASLSETQPLDYVSIDVPSKLSPAQMREVARNLLVFADEIEALYAAPRGAYTFNMAIEGYENALQENSSKAILLTEESVAILHDNNLWFGLISDGIVNLSSLTEPDPRGWDRKGGHWQTHYTVEETLKSIKEPTLVDYELIED